MKICESWLREWVDYSICLNALSQKLTLAGLEVDGCYPVAGAFEGVVVGHVLQTKKHPQADKLTLCQVDAGHSEPLQIVCGASNVRPGLKVALATVGARLPQGLQIKACKLRGEASHGMLCSTVELGIDEQSDGILELPMDAPVGTDLRDYLVLNDNVLDIELTPNRADCFSVLGVAREVSALTGGQYKNIPNTVITSTITDKLEVSILKTDACSNYAGRVIRRIRTDVETPIWMKERLRRSGLRSVHPVVDILNYVMLEVGQPMHAFDLECIEGGVCVRESLANESLTLLDGQTIELPPGILMIADHKKPLAIAGVMGGEQSAVKLETVDIFIESAFFSPIALAGTARYFGLNTDASQRFERGVDPAIQCQALEYATALIQQIVGGEAGPVQLQTYTEHLPINPSILFRPSRVARLTGVLIDDRVMIDIFEKLGMTVFQEENQWLVTSPTYRFDIQNETDLVEEALRVYGYDQISAQPITTEMRAGKMSPLEDISQSIAGFLANRGYRETISYSFVDPALQSLLYPNHTAEILLNPISSDLSQMRTGLWSGLIAAMIHNLHRQQTALKIFETGTVFHRIDDVRHEEPCAAGLLTGHYGQLNWREQKGVYDFFDLKGDVEALLSHLGQCDIMFKRPLSPHAALHPGKSAEIWCNNAHIGWIGALHPALMDALDISMEVLMFEVSLKTLCKPERKIYQTISRYPQTRRDLSLLIDDAVTSAEIEAAVREVVDSSCLKSFDVFDVYYGDSIPKGKKSLAIALTLQNDSRTLVDAEIQSMIESILQKLEGSFSAVLRAE